MQAQDDINVMLFENDEMVDSKLDIGSNHPSVS
jgi:hypothetical protein